MRFARLHWYSCNFIHYSGMENVFLNSKRPVYATSIQQCISRLIVKSHRRGIGGFWIFPIALKCGRWLDSTIADEPAKSDTSILTTGLGLPGLVWSYAGGRLMRYWIQNWIELSLFPPCDVLCQVITTQLDQRDKPQLDMNLNWKLFFMKIAFM